MKQELDGQLTCVATEGELLLYSPINTTGANSYFW